MGGKKDRLTAKLLTRFPSLFKRAAEKAGGEPLNLAGIPWTPFTGELKDRTIAIVTTAGVHLKSQKPFDMVDSSGDPSFRELPSGTPRSGYTITHDYYDHADADRDLNIVFPIDRLSELAREGFIGGLSPVNIGFMGHIDGPHIKTLMEKTAPEAARRLVSLGVGAALLTPG